MKFQRIREDIEKMSQEERSSMAKRAKMMGYVATFSLALSASGIFTFAIIGQPIGSMGFVLISLLNYFNVRLMNAIQDAAEGKKDEQV